MTPSNAKFIIDTCTLVNLTDFYPPDDKRQEHFWEKLKEKIDCEEVILLDEVHKEIKKYKGWLDQFCRKTKVTKLDMSALLNENMPKVTAVVDEFITKGSRTAAEKWIREGADPYIVAYAIKLRDAGQHSIVISDEGKIGDKSKQVKITNVCGKLSIPVYTSQNVYKEIMK